MNLTQWERQGHRIDTPDGRVWCFDSGAPEGTETSAVPLLLLHGFPTSSHDWSDVIERVSPTRRVVLCDYPGFGLSDKPSRGVYSIMTYTDAVLQVVAHFGVTRAHVWAHDLGTSVATELIARRERGILPFELSSLTLMNGSVHVELADPTFGQRALLSPLGPLFARLNNGRSFRAQMRRVMGRPVPDEALDAMWTLLARDDGASRLPLMIRYMHERRQFWERWIGALTRLDVPALVAWGERDPVAVMAIARQLAKETPGARFETWSALGHYPQVEDPDTVVGTVAKFLAEVDARAAPKWGR